MISRSIYNVSINTVYTYDIPIESAFLQLSNVIRHVVPSTDRRLELKVKDIDGSDRLTAGCVLINLANPAVSRTAVYASGLISISASSNAAYFSLICLSIYHSSVDVDRVCTVSINTQQILAE
jgi:hypothetical protein